MVEIKELEGDTGSTENSGNSNEETEIEANGEVPVAAQPDAVAGVGAAQEQQPTRLESFMAITKSLILRALVFYFITSFFRRPAPTPADQGGATAPAKLPAFNYFENGSIMVNENEF